MNHRWRLTDCSVYFRNVLSSEDISKPLKVFDEMSGLKNIMSVQIEDFHKHQTYLIVDKDFGIQETVWKKTQRIPFLPRIPAAHLNKGIHKIYSCDATTVSS
ncbi:unnamed protein product [Lactuca virosa]|uniref:Uncharacterized protein n=1 Tax=Lactuca virosa TaxID=75947 RepID=A0AAU9MU98_9ASTR|nr:unnamed protein product [Lactuca virosa]